MNPSRLLVMLVAVSLLLPLVAEPAVIWTVPSPAIGEKESRLREICLRWLNDDELIALRVGGVVGRYHCGGHKTIWEKRFTCDTSIAVAPTAVYVIEEQESERYLLKLRGADGIVLRKWSGKKLGQYALEDPLALYNLEWIADPGLLMIEALNSEGSDGLFFDPEALLFRAKVDLGGYLRQGSCVGKSLTWVNHGIIRQATPGDRKFLDVWNSGLGEGGDDCPGMRAYQVDADGGFAAVLDNGGWKSGARLFHREGVAGKVSSIEMTPVQDFRAVAIDLKHQRVWASAGAEGWLGCYDLSGKLVDSSNGLLPKNCWTMAVAPSGKRAAVVDESGAITFIELRGAK